MRTVTLPGTVDDDVEMDFAANFSLVDGNSTPGDVLADVSAELKKFGLEIVLYDRGSDDYMYRIVKRDEPIEGLPEGAKVS